MKKHFEQAIAFDRDNPLNQRVGLGKKYNELVDEYNALEAKTLGGKTVEIAEAQEDTVSDGATTDNKPTKNKSAKNKRG